MGHLARLPLSFYLLNTCYFILDNYFKMHHSNFMIIVVSLLVMNSNHCEMLEETILSESEKGFCSLSVTSRPSGRLLKATRTVEKGAGSAVSFQNTFWWHEIFEFILNIKATPQSHSFLNHGYPTIILSSNATVISPITHSCSVICSFFSNEAFRWWDFLLWRLFQTPYCPTFVWSSYLFTIVCICVIPQQLFM